MHTNGMVSAVIEAMRLRVSEPFSFQIASNRAVLGLLPILTVVTLVTGFPIAAFPSESQCEGLFDDSSEAFPDRRKELVLKYSQGAKDFSEVRTFGTNASELPYQEKQNLLQDIGAVYRIVPKKDPSPTAAWHIGGRRLLDYAQTLIARYDLYFSSEIGQGVSAAQAYGKFLKNQQELFATNYGAKEVFTIIQVLQKNLRSLQFLAPSGLPLKLLLAGSLINGKANLQKSDLDLTVSTPSLTKELSSWEMQVNEALSAALGEVPIQIILEAHGEPASFYGKINPVVIEITSESVRLLVFAPARVQQQATELQAGAFNTYLVEGR